MLPVRSLVVDFDGTACLHDVAEHLLVAFGDPHWPEYDDAVDRGEIGLREALEAQASLLGADRDELLRYAIDHCPIDPTFAPFVAWARSGGVPVTLVSDGFGFYIAPLLAAAGIHDVPVRTNTWDEGRLVFTNGHGECVGCGTCKMRAVLETAGPVAFVGEGQSDRWGAHYADVVFAKDALPAYCEADGVPYVGWTDFDDVRRWLETHDELPGPVAPVRCPGWTPPPSPTG
ncbi:MAG TPA: HAD-IB family phosphatase [Actinomycetota bacterium]